MIDKTFSEIIKRLTNRQFKVVAILITVGFIIFSEVRFFELTRSVFVKAFDLCIMNWYFTLGLLAPIITIMFLLRKSTKEFNKDWEKHYPNIEKWVSSNKRILQTKIIDNHQEQTREILIFNSQDSDLFDLEGEVKFYHHDYHFESIPFKIKHLEKGKGEKIVLDNYNTRKKQFNEFHTYIEKCRNHDLTNEVLKIYGKKFFRTHFLILNRCRFFLWWEYSWFSDKNRQLISWIKHRYSTPARYEHWGYWQYYRKRPWLYLGKLRGESWNFFWKRKLNQIKMIITCSILLGIILIFNISFYRIGKGIFEIIKSI